MRRCRHDLGVGLVRWLQSLAAYLDIAHDIL